MVLHSAGELLLELGPLGTSTKKTHWSESLSVCVCVGGWHGCLLLAPSIFPLPLCSLSQETNLYRPCQGHLWLLAVLADGEPGRKTAGRENIKLRVFIPLAPFLQGHFRLAHTSIYGQCSPPGNLLYMICPFPGFRSPGNKSQEVCEIWKRWKSTSSSHIQHYMCHLVKGHFTV